LDQKKGESADCDAALWGISPPKNAREGGSIFGKGEKRKELSLHLSNKKGKKKFEKNIRGGGNGGSPNIQMKDGKGSQCKRGKRGKGRIAGGLG